MFISEGIWCNIFWVHRYLNDQLQKTTVITDSNKVIALETECPGHGCSLENAVSVEMLFHGERD